MTRHQINVTYIHDKNNNSLSCLALVKQIMSELSAVNHDLHN